MGLKGNQFWKIRSTHGREKLFATPELLWEAACEYFQWVDKHPWKRNEAIKSGELAGKTMKVSTERPYTLSGLCIYLEASESFWRNFKRLPSLTNDFLTVINKIEEIISTQQFEGAAVGAFNANIIARKQGLVEKVETNSKNTNFNYNSVDLTEAEIKAFRKALEDEI